MCLLLGYGAGAVNPYVAFESIEARDRCRMAIVNSPLPWPSTKRITVLLSPADLPKSGTHFDLAIAVAILAGDGAIDRAALAGTVFIGELTLTGGLRSVPGVLPMVLAASERGIRRVFVPEPQAREAAMVPGMTVLGMRSLAQIVAELAGEQVPEAAPVAPMSGRRLLSWRGQERMGELDMADLLGMDDARYAVEVAAAGGHHLMLSGPKGAGKTTLAERMPGILPDLSPQESLELTAIHSLAGALEPGDDMITRPPFFAPHHDASKVGLLGGGSGRVRPGEVSRAHCGVLFLDEFPLFRTDVIEALRQPLESGEVTITRGDESATFPARGIVVFAANPCPCGDYHPDARQSRCSCTERKRRDYRSRVTGPIADRIDILRHLAAAEAAPGARSVVDARELRDRPGPGRAGAAAAGGAVHRPQLAAQRAGVRGRCCARSGRWPRPRSAASTTSSTPAGSAGGVPPGCTGWRGRLPTSPGFPHPTCPRSTPRCACGPATRSSSRPPPGARDDRPGRRRRAAGTSRPRSPRRAG